MGLTRPLLGEVQLGTHCSTCPCALKFIIGTTKTSVLTLLFCIVFFALQRPIPWWWVCPVAPVPSVSSYSWRYPSCPHPGLAARCWTLPSSNIACQLSALRSCATSAHLLRCWDRQRWKSSPVMTLCIWRGWVRNSLLLLTVCVCVFTVTCAF